MRRDQLTPRQREVLDLLTRGLSNKEIARMLGIAEATTKIHVAGLLKNIDARNRTEAAFRASEFLDGESQFTRLIRRTT
jgi:DNA-binding NarL/FixJ family response regulator